MIITFSRKPSTRFTERVRAALVFDEDWTFLAEALDAKVRAGKLVAYLKHCAESGTYPTADVIAYILTDADFDSFKAEVTKKQN